VGRLRLVVAGAAVLALGVVAVLAGLTLLGLVGAVVGAAAAGSGVVMLRSTAARVTAARAHVEQARLRADAIRVEAAQVQARYDAAVARTLAAGLPIDPVVLRGHARREIQQQAFEVRDEQRRQEAADRLTAVARLLGLDAGTPEQAEHALRGWQSEQMELAATLERYALDERQLRTLLRGEDLDALRTRVTALEEQAGAASAAVAAQESTVDDESAMEMSTMDEPDLPSLRSAAEEAGRREHGAEVALAQWLAGVRPVGEAEEEVARARAELDRLRELDQTLDITQKFLASAQESAHRTIAPRLAETVRAWLPRATGGRYTEVTVDPDRLEVRVRAEGGRWRDAARLSYGTAEQVYLMLRIALAQHLAAQGVRCPLLLDDVTVHADGRRTEELLELLRFAAEDRQIILFSQQAQVAEWARTRLGPRDALLDLAPVTAV
jgi:DNA repair exonuclease SbcCD ATPase subunit